MLEANGRLENFLQRGKVTLLNFRASRKDIMVSHEQGPGAARRPAKIQRGGCVTVGISA
jgi:hypothetical protein